MVLKNNGKLIHCIYTYQIQRKTRISNNFPISLSLLFLSLIESLVFFLHSIIIKVLSCSDNLFLQSLNPPFLPHNCHNKNSSGLYVLLTSLILNGHAIQTTLLDIDVIKSINFFKILQRCLMQRFSNYSKHDAADLKRISKDITLLICKHQDT